MNWYKSANLIDEIKRMGPNYPVEDINDPRIKYFSEKHKMSSERVFEILKNDKLLADSFKRDYFTKEYGWSVPSKEAIQKIKEFVGQDKVIEIGSGHGMWAKLMIDNGITVAATDSFSHRAGFVSQKKPFTEVEDLEAIAALKKYGAYNVLMLSWPPCGDKMASNSLKTFNGNKSIFIGEGKGGCTGDDEFFDILSDNWKQIELVAIPRWFAIHDYLSLFVRK